MTVEFLPPAYGVRGKVLFLQVSVCPHFGGGRGTPSQVQVGGGGVPHPRSRWGTQSSRGYPILGPGGGGVPRGTSPVQDWIGYPPPNQETEQHNEHLLCGGRYASCVHAGGLSCG